MRITAIHEKTIGIASTMRNADIGFDEMTASLIAVVTDVKRDGRPVIGYGFDSIGRYAHGAVARERLIPRLLAAEPKALVTDDGANLDPHRSWAAMMRNEKLGGHGERAGAVGVLDMAIWDAVAKIEGKPLWRLLAERYRGGATDARVRVYAAGGHYHPEGGVKALQDELRRYRDLGHATVKIKVGGGPHEQDMARIEASLAVVGDSNWRSMPTPPSTSNGPTAFSPRPRHSTSPGSRRSAIRSTSRSRPSSPRATRCRWRPARTFSPVPTRAT